MISGGGRTLLNLLDHAERGDLPIDIGIVIASADCPGVERARARALDVIVEPGVIPPKRLEDLVSGSDWVLLCGYLKLVQIPDSLAGRVVNIHPALLPKFGGPGMYGDRVHAAVLAAGETESGCTIHLCDHEFDRGQIVLQRRCPVEAGDTVASLASRVFELEKQAYPDALRMLISQHTQCRPIGEQP